MGLQMAEQGYYLGWRLEGKVSRGGQVSWYHGVHTSEHSRITQGAPFLLHSLIGHCSLLNTEKSPFLLNIFGDLLPNLYDRLHLCCRPVPCGSSSITQLLAASGPLCVTWDFQAQWEGLATLLSQPPPQGPAEGWTCTRAAGHQPCLLPAP